MRRVVMLVCAALLFLPLEMKSRGRQVTSAAAPFRALSRGPVFVKVSGDVVHSGIYEISANTLAMSVIIMAEPLRPLKHYKPDTAAALTLQNGSSVNLTALPDGSHLVTVNQMTVPERMVMKIPLEISTMSEADLDRLPGIGPALAKRIVKYRQNNGGILCVEDLVLVEGIGEKKLNMIRSYLQHP